MKFKEIINLLALFVAGGIFGGLLGAFHFKFVEVLMFLWEHILTVIEIGYFLIPCIALYTLYKYFDAKKYVQEVGEDDDSFKKADKKLSDTLSLSNIFTFVLFVFYGILYNFEKIFIYTGIFLISVIIFVVIQVLCVKQTKLIYPEKKGDPTTLKFSKDWYDSCDEAEKMLIGKCAYKSYTASMSVSIAVLLFAIFLKMVNVIDGLTILLIGIIILTISVTYTLEARKNDLK